MTSLVEEFVSENLYQMKVVISDTNAVYIISCYKRADFTARKGYVSWSKGEILALESTW